MPIVLTLVDLCLISECDTICGQGSIDEMHNDDQLDFRGLVQPELNHCALFSIVYG